MAGLVPAIHAPRPGAKRGMLRQRPGVDARDKPGHDGPSGPWPMGMEAGWGGSAGAPRRRPRGATRTVRGARPRPWARCAGFPSGAGA
ncbi:hypothetical protein D9R14_07980 [Xanthobacter tagetidis]|uniref:Uncharacterized protein n=1 Tax=Xanthobacter tagetidis TaxID=60216 RepID=A0A3L7AJ23_9HYPH|nr:hypothetical protein D9R14_07980 [Xanthobacter tagetidis]